MCIFSSTTPKSFYPLSSSMIDSLIKCAWLSHILLMLKNYKSMNISHITLYYALCDLWYIYYCVLTQGFSNWGPQKISRGKNKSKIVKVSYKFKFRLYNITVIIYQTQLKCFLTKNMDISFRKGVSQKRFIVSGGPCHHKCLKQP